MVPAHLSWALASSTGSLADQKLKQVSTILELAMAVHNSYSFSFVPCLLYS